MSRVAAAVNRRTKSMYEHHYTPAELARRWGFSTDTIREMFRDEPGTILITHPEQEGKRVYNSMRIPESVADRVYASYQKKEKKKPVTSISVGRRRAAKKSGGGG